MVDRDDGDGAFSGAGFMRLRTTTLATALLAASIGSVSGQQAASAAKSTLADLVGLYEGQRGFIAIVPLDGAAAPR